MRAFVLGLSLILPLAAKAADRSLDGLCLSPGETHEAVATREVVPPTQAIVTARRAAPNADLLRAALCHESEGLAYRIVLLRKDGRLVRVTLDAPSGRVKFIH